MVRDTFRGPMGRSLTASRGVIYGAALVLLAVVLWLPRLRGPLDLRYDAGVYYILGTSLAEGKGYRLLNEPGAIQAIQYPPLLPLFVATHQWFTGSSDPATAGQVLRISFFVMFVALVIAGYGWSRHYLTPGWAFLATLVTLLHVHTTWMSDLLFAELPFALTSVLFLLVARRSTGPSGEWLAGALAGAGFLLRSSGIALLGAWVGESLLRRRFKQMVVRIGLALVPVLAWQGYVASVKQGSEYAHPAYLYQRANYQYYNVGYSDNLVYVDPFAPELGRMSPRLWLERLGANIVRMPAGIGGAVSVRREWIEHWLARIGVRVRMLPAVARFTGVVWLSVLGILVVSGLVLLARRGEWLVGLYAAITLGLVGLTPWFGQLERYLWPLTPLLAVALWTAVAFSQTTFLGRRPWRIAVMTMVATVLLGVLSTQSLALIRTYGLSTTASYGSPSEGRREYILFFYGPEWRLHAKALDWLGAHARPDEIVATSTPHWVYLRTGLRSVMPPFEPDVREAQRLVDSVPVSYLIVDSLRFVDVSRRYGAPIVSAFPGYWELIESASNKSSRVYRRTLQKDHPMLATWGDPGL